jgi:hypothetical protein
MEKHILCCCDFLSSHSAPRMPRCRESFWNRDSSQSHSIGSWQFWFHPQEEYRGVEEGRFEYARRFLYPSPSSKILEIRTFEGRAHIMSVLPFCEEPGLCGHNIALYSEVLRKPTKAQKSMEGWRLHFCSFDVIAVCTIEE